MDGRAVQGAGFRHQSLRRRGFESHSNHLKFFFLSIFFFFATRITFAVARTSSELAQRKRVGLITQRSQDRNLDSLSSRLAQLVERKTLNLVVEGSSPSVGIFLFFYFTKIILNTQKKIYACRDSNSGFPACEAGVITRLDHTRTVFVL